MQKRLIIELINSNIFYTLRKKIQFLLQLFCVHVCISACRFIIKWNESIYWYDSQACFFFQYMHSWISVMISFCLPASAIFLLFRCVCNVGGAHVCNCMWYCLQIIRLFALFFSPCFKHFKPIWIATADTSFIFCVTHTKKNSILSPLLISLGLKKKEMFRNQFWSNQLWRRRQQRLQHQPYRW